MFQFGQTRFIDLEEARILLRSGLIPLRKDGAGLHPVNLLGHAIDNDTEMIKQHLGIDLNAQGNLATVLDSQFIAQKARIKHHNGHLFSFRNILAPWGSMSNIFTSLAMIASIPWSLLFSPQLKA